MSPVGFRTRLFLILTLFATLPSIALTLVWGGTFARALPLVSGSSAWERAAVTGGKAIAAAQQAPLSASDRAALRAHELELQESLTQARRFGFIAQRAVPVTKGQLDFGPWQRVFYGEWDGQRPKRVVIKAMGE